MQFLTCVNKLVKSDRAKAIFIAGIVFLFLRNFPLCFLMPIWSHGDEIGHFDYVLKINKGRLPKPGEQIELNLFELHKNRYDSRYISPQGNIQVDTLENFGLAQYSYEAHQPPLPYLIMAVFRFFFLQFGASMLLQVKLMRVVSLLAVAAGLFFLYSGLRRIKVKQTVFYLPFLLIPIIGKDMFFSVNTDSFSFMFSSIAVMGAILLFENPRSGNYWLITSMGMVFALWTKVPNAFLFALWIPLTWLLWRKEKDAKILRLSLVFLLLGLVFASPWYIWNFLRFGNPFSYMAGLPFPDVPPQNFSFPKLGFFFSGLFITLFRGEYVWNGVHFSSIHGALGSILYIYLPALAFFMAALTFFSYPNCEKIRIHRYFILCGAGTVLAFCVSFFFMGGIPFYQARYAYGGLYFLMYIYAVGWQKIVRSPNWEILIPVGLMLFDNAFFTYTMLSKVY